MMIRIALRDIALILLIVSSATLPIGCGPKKETVATTNPIYQLEIIDAYAQGTIEGITGGARI